MILAAATTISTKILIEFFLNSFRILSAISLKQTKLDRACFSAKYRVFTIIFNEFVFQGFYSTAQIVAVLTHVSSQVLLLYKLWLTSSGLLLSDTGVFSVSPLLQRVHIHPSSANFCSIAFPYWHKLSLSFYYPTTVKINH